MVIRIKQGGVFIHAVVINSFHKVLDSLHKAIFLGLKKLESKHTLVAYLPLSSLILTLDCIQSLNLKETVGYLILLIGLLSGINDEPEFSVLQGEVIMRTHQCELIAILPNP